MKIVFAGNKERGITCLRASLDAGHDVALVLGHPGSSFADEASRLGCRVERPSDPNAPEVVAGLESLRADLLVLAGYSPILRRPTLEAFRLGAVNLHGGKLPQYRGSSPMNWAIMHGAREITLSVISVTERIDSGDVLAERTFAVSPAETIRDVQHYANELFPPLLVAVLEGIAAGTLSRRRQDESTAVYWPMRFPQDGLVVFDLMTAQQVHDRVRSLTSPYPGAFTYHGGRQVMLWASAMPTFDHRGEPGRVYRTGGGRILVCAGDRCLWITSATFASDGTDALAAIPRYAQLATARGRVLP